MKAPTIIPIDRTRLRRTVHGVEEVPDHRVRCTLDDKVVFATAADAAIAAQLITRHRQAMKHYLGRCGHWHLARVKGKR